MDEFIAWTAKQERVTLYQDADGVWFLEWFNLQAKYNWKSNKDINQLITEVIKSGK